MDLFMLTIVALTVSVVSTGLSAYVLVRLRRAIARTTPPERVAPNLALTTELLAEALDEQERREKAHHLTYRGDQRVHAVQQRLSRKMGPIAFGEVTADVIRAELKNRGKAS